MGDRTDANPKTRAMQAPMAIFTRMRGASAGETPAPQGESGLMPYSSPGIALGFTLKPVAGMVRHHACVGGNGAEPVSRTSRGLGWIYLANDG
jgi:hypothetical protein